MKMNVYQRISQIIKSRWYLIGPVMVCLSQEGYNIFTDDAWFQENMGDFRKIRTALCFTRIFSANEGRKKKWAFVKQTC